MIWLIACLIVVLVVAWNFYPPFREKVRGWSTIMEAVLITGLYYADFFVVLLDDLQAQGLVPPQFDNAIPVIMGAYVILKRIQSSKPAKRVEGREP